jgi:hypothetical protein
MKKFILTFLTILPLGNLSVASSIKLNELDQDEKVELINELLESASTETQDLVANEAEVKTIDQAINLLLKDPNVVNSLENKKEAGSGSGI